jgi:hypothetical protein
VNISLRRAGAVAAGAIVAVVTVSLLTARSNPDPISMVSPAASYAPSRVSPTSGPSEASPDPTDPTATEVRADPVSPKPRLDAEPTRVVIEALGIDLPVIRPRPDEVFPLCDVAEFLPSYGLPGLPGVTYIYAHARTGMFLPLLDTSRIAGGAAMRGHEVVLYSSDRFRRRYVISEVHTRVKTLDVVNELVGDALVLQTSETSHSSGTKLVIVARPTGAPELSTKRAAQPSPRPRVCVD